MEKQGLNTIDEYISNYPSEIQEVLENLRKVIREAAPEATEKISWGMPTFVLHGNLVHFAVNKGYIGFYPASSGVEVFKSLSNEYKGTKGSIHLPLSKPIPFDLISKVVEFRVEENKKEAEKKQEEKNARKHK